MPKRAGGPSVAVGVNFGSAVPAYRQLYEGLREAILSGRLRPGSRLPATRRLAEELAVSRNTVMRTFELLVAEGYVESRVGSGTFVSSELPEALFQAVNEGAGSLPRGKGKASASRRGRRLAGRILEEASHAVGEPRPFRPRVPELAEFPWRLWCDLTARACRGLPRKALAYGDPAGYRSFREAIAEHVAAVRAIRCDPEQVIVTSGGQQALHLAVSVLLDPDDAAWIEDPADPGAHAALLAAGARPVPVAVDEEGLIVGAGREARPHARLAYVCPSHQYVLGATMSLERRLELLRWAREEEAWILENDYDSEYRYVGAPLSALQGLDGGDRVVYAGTFSQVLFPGVRMGYLVVPYGLVGAFHKARRAVDVHPPVLQQLVITEFMREGHLDRHVKRMRRLYAARQDALVDASRRELAGLLEVRRNDSGMHLVGWLPEGASGAAASGAARERGVEAPAVSAYALRRAGRDGLLLGYAAFDEARIQDGTKKLAAALRLAQ